MLPQLGCLMELLIAPHQDMHHRKLDQDIVRNRAWV